MLKKVAVVFPGQGSQYEGLGRDIIDSDLEIGKVYTRLKSILGKDSAEKIIKASKEDLSKTRYAQVAIFLDSLLLYKEFIKEFANNLEIGAFAGLSLGEYSALCASGAFDLEEGISLIAKRGEIMEEAASGKGSMIAVMKSDFASISSIIKEVKKEESGVLDICNLNSPSQIVVGGEFKALEIFKKKSLEKGIKNLISLDVEGPFHTEILKDASEEFSKYLDKLTFKIPKCQVYSNYDAKTYLTREDFSIKLRKQMYSPVYFEKIIREILESGINDFIEIGPGKTLKSFIKKIDRKANVYNIEKIEDIAGYREIIDSYK